jgi:hypothetical protein
MGQQDNFFGGFLAGAIVGGMVGGVLGAVAASRINQNPSTNTGFAELNSKTSKNRRRMKLSTEQSIEAARKGLEDKIAQLNEAIDDVRQQLGGVNGNSDGGEEAILPDR